MSAVDEWVLEYRELAAPEEGIREALCTLGNGVFATRGAAPEATADAVHYPGTYVAGLYNRLVSEVAERRLEHESLVNLPNWLPLTCRPKGGDWLDPLAMELEAYRQRLDLRRGLLTRELTVRDTEGRRTLIAERRLVSMADPHLAALEWTITPQNWSGALDVRSFLDGSVENRNVADERALAGRHLRVLGSGEAGDEVVWLEAGTQQSHVRVAEAARTRASLEGAPVGAARRSWRDGDRIGHELAPDVSAGQALRVEKVAAVHTARDAAISEPRVAALAHVGDAGGFDELLAAHELAWEHLWWRCDLEFVDGDPETSRALRLHVFHVLQTLSAHVVDRDVGAPARGLHGEGYRGHVFWDELFVFPFLNLRIPELTRELLLYRFRRLPAARRLARQAGCAGAMFPWQSGSDGRDETPVELYNPRSRRWMPDNSRRQRHVGLAVAYNVWQYFEVTADRDFLAASGAELLVEIARCWTSLATLDPADGRYHIRGVMGPDEFHDGYPERPGEGVDDNAYTNVMVSWLLRRAAAAYQLLSDYHCGELWERLALGRDEVRRWQELSRLLHVPFLESGIIAQFAGYGELEELDWEEYRRRYGDIGRLDLILEAEGDTPNRYQASKQADALMLFYLFSAEELTELFANLGYEFDPQSIPATIDYYLARTSNGSTLSRVAHAWVLTRSDRERSWKLFAEALGSDLYDIQGGTTREGIHLGAMAGTIDLVQRCYMGVEPRDGVLWLNPRLPAELRALRLSLRYREHWIDIEVAGERLHVSTRPCEAEPVRIGLLGEAVEMRPGDSRVVSLATAVAGARRPRAGPSR